MTLRTVLFVLLALCITWNTQAQDMQERVSPPDTVTGTIDGVRITVAYSQPSVKGREIWGNLVPYDKIWRAGANEATVFEINKSVLIEGKELRKGRYAFFLVPNESGAWTAIFNSDAKQWGAYKHDSKKDVLRVSVSPEKHGFVEQMKFELADNEVRLNWENLSIPLEVKGKK